MRVVELHECMRGGEGRGVNVRGGEGSECKGRRPEGVEGNGEEGWLGGKLTEKSWVVCLLCRSDGDEMRVNMIWALWMFEKPRPLTFRGIPPLYSGEWHIICHVSSKHITGHMLVM